MVQCGNGSQGYLGEMFVRNDEACNAFTKIALITNFSLKKSLSLTEISTVGQLKKDDFFKNYEANIKTWSIALEQIYLENEAGQILLANAIDKSIRIWIKLVPKRNYGVSGRREIFIGMGFVVANDVKNPMQGATSVRFQVLGTGPLQKMIESVDNPIGCDNVCSETEYIDSYRSYSCAGEWSTPEYFATGAGSSSPVWTQSSCVAYFYKSAGFYPNFNFAVSPPTTQTTTPPPIPTLTVDPSCISGQVGTTDLYGIGFGIYSTNIADTDWHDVNPSTPAVSFDRKMSYVGRGFADILLNFTGYSYPPAVPAPPASYPLSCLTPGSKDNEVANGFKFEAISAHYSLVHDIPSSLGRDCIIDSGFATYSYKAQMMLVTEFTDHGAPFTGKTYNIDLRVEFYTSSGALLLTRTMPRYSTHNAMAWNSIDLNGVLPVGCRKYRVFLTWNTSGNISTTNFYGVYGYFIDYTTSPFNLGMRIQF